MELLEKHFETAFDTPNGIKELRSLILKLAMMGKLVPQDPSDQPASELLKEIQAEKEKLITEGKIKKQKALLDIMPEELPYDLPEHWAWCRLNEIGQIVGGGTPNMSKKEYWNGDIDWVSPKDMKDKEINRAQMKITMEGVKSSSTNIIPLNSLFMVGRSGILKRKFPVAINNIPCALNQDMKALIPYSQNMSLFLFSMLKGLEPIILRFFVKYGMTVHSLKYKEFENMPVPLPPLSEQKRIVTKINELMARCDKMERLKKEQYEKRLQINAAALHHLLESPDKESFQNSFNFITRNFSHIYSVKENVEELKKSILQLAMMGKLVPQDPNDQPASELLKEIQAEKEKLIGEGKIKRQRDLPAIKTEEIPYAVPAGWEFVYLGNIVTQITKGATPTTYGFHFIDIGIPFIKVENVKNGSIQHSEKLQYISDEAHQFQKRSQLREFDILFSIAGTIGENCVVKKEDLPANINQALAIIRGYNKHFISDFLILVLNSIVSDKIKNRARGAAMNNISLGDVKEMIVPMPPLEEQNRIVTKINELMRYCDSMEDKIDQSELIREKLLQSVLANV